MGTKNYEVALKAIEGLAHAAEFLADLHDRLPDGEESEAVVKAGLALCEGGNALLDQLEDGGDDVDGDVGEVEPETSPEVLRNEVVTFAGLTFFASRVLWDIAKHSDDEAARETAQTAHGVIRDAIAAMPDVEGDRSRGIEAVEFSSDCWDEALDRADEYGEDDEDFDSEDDDYNDEDLAA